MDAPILSLRDLAVTFSTPDGPVDAVRGVSFDLHAGETLAIVGESGSGKSQTAMALLGLLAANGMARGSARFRGTELIGLPRRALDRLRGDKLTVIFQEPMTSLDPLYRIGTLLAEPIRHHRRLGGKALRARILALLRLVGIPEPERRIRSYPHELSGGQRQRVMIAMALANDPDILIADEPTTALDVTVQAQILDLLRCLQRRFAMAVVLITHDLGVVRHFADRVMVMRRGAVVEQGRTADIFARPAALYTRMLIDAEPRGRKAPAPADAPVLLEGRDVCVDFPIGGVLFGAGARSFRAVAGVSLHLRAGETLGIVGESGSGKSTLGRALLRLLPSTGRITFETTDISRAGRGAMRPLRHRLQLVFQDPFGSLSPRLTVGEIVTEGLLVHEPGLARAEREARAAAVLSEVGLDAGFRNRYPHELSGGQRQRVAIARAMILKPHVVVLDEPTSALDRSVQAQVLALLRRLQADHTLSYVFISHDLAVIRAMADRVVVMKDGRIVEEGTTDQIFEAPREDYTRALIDAAHR
jgi:oligopeptide transport system ATP-binding protein